ncbi:hypothetical protein G7Y89_g3145 [Cudoniella acicularis]|uniref:Heterokaryon incompatibility domain-containing protein n=1 Tax=Cudoniella acicularis TaxID=354080 RepID=A0A8H4RRZ2_9HELO|nr:hypothetical protein G7Y89_g3145 [Cudoniella acicularis]
MKKEYIRHLQSRTKDSDFAHPFGRKANYDALSYTCGVPTPKTNIFIDGLAFPVGPSLESALRHLRDVDEEKVLWIDATRIDQNNIEERNIQVQRMAQIYRQAPCVLIWLGEVEKEMVLSPRMQNFSFGVRNVLRPRDYSQLRDPTETRMWIVQELTYPATARVFCGHRSINWDTIENMITVNPRTGTLIRLNRWFAEAFKPLRSLVELRSTAQKTEMLSTFGNVYKHRGTSLRTLVFDNAE